MGKLYLDAVVDTYGSYAFGFLHTGKVPEAAAAVLHNDVLPFYQDRGLTVAAILTDTGKEYCGTDAHPYELYLGLNDVEHRITLDEFFRTAFRTRFYESVEALQADLDAWLAHHNTERPHLGYRNHGKRPLVVGEEASKKPSAATARAVGILA